MNMLLCGGTVGSRASVTQKLIMASEILGRYPGLGLRAVAPRAVQATSRLRAARQLGPEMPVRQPRKRHLGRRCLLGALGSQSIRGPRVVRVLPRAA